MNEYYEGERSLFGAKNLEIKGATFGTGESSLKESKNIKLDTTIFKWKYPLWYSKNIVFKDSIWETMACSGIWYTDSIKVSDTVFQAPKNFRRCRDVELDNVYFADAEETLWTCNDVKLTNVRARGDYFGMNSSNFSIENLDLVGNYCFDGGKSIEVHNSCFVSKDAFWNCENVTIYDSFINGEYLAWNTKNLTLINCSLLRNDLCFEYCSEIDADVTTDILSIKNPLSGKIRAKSVEEIIFDDQKVDASKTMIETEEK